MFIYNFGLYAVCALPLLVAHCLIPQEPIALGGKAGQATAPRQDPRAVILSNLMLFCYYWNKKGSAA